MTPWTVVPCDVCNRQTVSDEPDGMVVCETCLARWDAEDEAAGLAIFDFLDEDPLDELC